MLDNDDDTILELGERIVDDTLDSVVRVDDDKMLLPLETCTDDARLDEEET